MVANVKPAKPTKQAKKRGNPNILDIGHDTRWKTGQTGTPNGPPLAKVHLWRYIQMFSEMTWAEISKMRTTGKINNKPLSMSQRSAIAFISKLSEGEQFQTKEALDRDEGPITNKIDINQNITQISQEVATMDEETVNNRIKDIASNN